MIAPIAVSASAIRSSCNGRNVRELNALHEDITEAVLAHGHVVFASDSERSQFIRSLKELERHAPDASKRWEAALIALQAYGRTQTRHPPAETSLEDVASLGALRRSWRGHLGVAVVEDDKAESLGVEERAWSWVDPETGIEVARAGAGWHCATFKGFRDLWTEGVVETGTSRDELWERFLLSIVPYSHTISIFDRYAASNIIRRHRDSQAHRYRITALGWLLQQIDATVGAQVEVELFTGNDAGAGGTVTISQLRDAVSTVWGGRPGARAIQRIYLHMASWAESRQLPHDRHIRFDVGCAVEFPAGLSVLDKPRLREDVTVVYKWLPTPLRKAETAEDDVRNDATTVTATIS
jgi:hypothetical protein